MNRKLVEIGDRCQCGDVRCGHATVPGKRRSKRCQHPSVVQVTVGEERRFLCSTCAAFLASAKAGVA